MEKAWSFPLQGWTTTRTTTCKTMEMKGALLLVLRAHHKADRQGVPSGEDHIWLDGESFRAAQSVGGGRLSVTRSE